MRRGGASVVAQVVARVAASPDRAFDGPRPAARPFGPTHYLTLDGRTDERERTDADVASRYRLERRRRRPGGWLGGPSPMRPPDGRGAGKYTSVPQWAPKP